jgi:hypothetical protein
MWCSCYVVIRRRNSPDKVQFVRKRDGKYVSQTSCQALVLVGLWAYIGLAKDRTFGTCLTQDRLPTSLQLIPSQQFPATKLIKYRYIINILSEDVRDLNGTSITQDIIISLRDTGWSLRRIFHQSDKFAPREVEAMNVTDRNLFMRLSRKT